MASPADVFWLSSKEVPTDDRKSRGYVLLTDISAVVGTGSLAYGSTQRTHEHAGSPAVPIAARRSGPGANGFWKTTWVHPGLLYAVEGRHLASPVGALTQKELADILKEAPAAVGAGTGTVEPRAGEPRSPGLRGVVVKFTPEWTARILFSFGVLLTPHPYAISPAAYHLVVPLLVDPKRLVVPDVELSRQDWHQWLGRDGREVKRVVAAISSVSTVKRDRLIGIPNAVCSHDSMEKIDDALLTWLGVPPAPVGAAVAETDTSTPQEPTAGEPS